MILAASSACAGPPFRTDDPQPVDHHHWEFYLASMYAKDQGGFSGTAPHVELNNGAWENIQLHVILPLSFVHPSGGTTAYGVGDVELGAKYRFIEETESLPQIGTFPQLEIPTGEENQGLGNGSAQLFLPLWVQKSWGPWTTYGGGGYWHNPGHSELNNWFFGWELQRDFSSAFTLGVEVFHSTARGATEGARTGYKLGMIVNFSEEHHLLASVGRDLGDGDVVSIYLAYQWTFGPG
jgi:hypothetical protein